MDIRIIGWKNAGWIQVAQDRVHCRVDVNTVMNLGVSRNKRGISWVLSERSLSWRNLLHSVNCVTPVLVRAHKKVPLYVICTSTDEVCCLSLKWYFVYDSLIFQLNILPTKVAVYTCKISRLELFILAAMLSIDRKVFVYVLRTEGWVSFVDICCYWNRRIIYLEPLSSPVVILNSNSPQPGGHGEVRGISLTCHSSCFIFGWIWVRTSVLKPVRPTLLVVIISTSRLK
jgi:hypothetical protein